MRIRFCGIDIAKDSFHAALIDEQGQVLWSRSFPMSSDGFADFLRAVRLPGSSLRSLRLGMESSGSYYLNLFSFLQTQGLDVRLLNPLPVSNFAKLSLRKTKTDKRDATTIAEFLRANPQALPQPHPADDELRALARARENISRQIVSLKNEIKRYLTLVFPEILRFLNPFTASSLRLLAAFPSKDAFLQASPQTLRQLLAGSGRGRKPSLALQNLIEAARTSVGLASPNFEAILRSKIRILTFLQKELKEMSELLLQRCRDQVPLPLKILNSIPGLNMITVSHFLAETHGRSFSTPQKLIAYAGLDPAVYESGQWKGRGHISKRGNKSLRRVLFLMAVGVIRVNPIFQQVYTKKRAEGKRYKQAVLVVAHKLLRVIHALLRRQIPFSPAYQSL
jgi:transposase